MKQFTFTSQLAPIIWKYLESRQNEGYTSVHCGYYMQELDCLSKELSDAPVVTKELIDAWDLLKPYLSNRSKIVRHNAIRAFAKFAYTQDGISYVPDTSKLKNSSTFTPHIFTVEEIRRLLYAADNLPVRNNAPTRHLEMCIRDSSLGMAFVAGSTRVPRPAAGMTALRIFCMGNILL